MAGPLQVSDMWRARELIKAGVSASTIFQIATQLIRENGARSHKAFRPALQALIGFDVFYKLLRKRNPQFTSFFTNHVAGLMHRYWRDLFPRDFEEPITETNEASGAALPRS